MSADFLHRLANVQTAIDVAGWLAVIGFFVFGPFGWRKAGRADRVRRQA